MTARLEPNGSARPGASQVGRETSRLLHRHPWSIAALRAGLGTRGVVYVALAYLVARIASGAMGTSTSTSDPASGPGVAQAILAQPGGRCAVFVLAVGLLCYAGFSAVDAVSHHARESPAAKRWGDRLLSAWGVVVYGAFAGYCFALAASGAGSNSGSGHESRQDAQWSARVLRWPGGQVWLGLLGVVLLGISAFLLFRTVRRSYRPRLERDRMSDRAWRVTVFLGAAGYFGRALLFGIVGWFVVSAAVTDDPGRGQGVDGSVRLLAAHPAGPPVLSVLAAGLLAYGLYVCAEARYRRV